jgi:hypothetical protein
MKNKFILALALGFLSAASAAGGIVNPELVCDWTRVGFFFARDFFIPQPPRLGIVKAGTYKKQLSVYRNLPAGFFHAGNLLFFVSESEESPASIACRAIELTDYYRSSSLRSDIRTTNSASDDIIAGRPVVIPVSLPGQVEDCRNSTIPKIIHSRGLYFSGTSAGSNSFLKDLPTYRELGFNTIVFDVKDITGIINYKSGLKKVIELDMHEHSTIDNMPKLVRECRKNGFYLVARIAVFHDHLLRKRDPSCMIKSKRTGKSWHPDSNEKWCDPTNKNVQDYNLGIALELSDIGVDEIQFDYIRFPTTGDISDADYAYSFGKMGRDEVIAHFLKRARTALAKKNTRLSIDIFGVVAWGKEIDICKTGQRISLLAKYCDVISPMLYPSHFNDDFDGYAKPGDHPYYFIYEGCKKVMAMSGKGAVVRPWLQAFNWRVSNYNRKYIIEQVRASDEAGAKGYLFWNASNDYRTVLGAFEEMKDTGLKLAAAERAKRAGLR